MPPVGPTVHLTDRPRAADGVVLTVRPGDGDGAPNVDPPPDALRGWVDLDALDLPRILAREPGAGAADQVLAVPVPTAGPELLLLAGVGDGSARAWRRAGAAVARRSRALSSIAMAATTAGSTELRALIEGLLLGSYSFSIASDPHPPALHRIDLVGAAPPPDEAQRAWTAGVATATATARARDLVNTPSLTKSPSWLAGQARTLGRRGGLTVRVRDPKALAAEGFGGLLAVGRGSARGPRLIEMRWDPPTARRHVVLVGKGITFDSGGLSLKPAEPMAGMKTDMAGGAAVIGAMSVLRDLDLPVKVTGLVAAAENMPSGSALRPGDVIRHYGGRTVEVLNTDAEGRLVLADALAYTDAELDPDVVVDLATLTGAMRTALGSRIAGLFTPDDHVAAQLAEAAEASGERLWRMPLIDDYADALESPIADLRNIGDPDKHYSGGAIAAALFLRTFVGGRRWGHLDIAGPARADADDAEVSKGGTGWGARLLLHWLEARTESAEARPPRRTAEGRR